MSLFQKSIIRSEIQKISDSEIKEHWDAYRNYFHNKKVQLDLITIKEQGNQTTFLTKTFCDIFGYTLNEAGVDGNIFREVGKSEFADGAIKKDGEVIAVIELKSSKTKNLKDIEDQVFKYQSRYNCNYAITSNFYKLRIYINSSSEYEEFDLFNLDIRRFKVLWICLSKANLFDDLPRKLKDKSLVEEKIVTNSLYKDYSAFRKDLFKDLKTNNPFIPEIELLNSTQKLLDRLLFIFFGEDKGLLPENLISEIIGRWQNRVDYGDLGDDEYLYHHFQNYFQLINKGRKAKNNIGEIFPYNGGLFKEDGLLNSLIISDETLKKHTLKLTSYDFESDISVNILGHIFEHSLTEIEELQNQIEGRELDKTSSKRKKDGVFYTPQYITKYIVDNTVGKLCEEKKIELNIIEDEYFKGRKGRKKSKLESLRDTLEEYRKWLLGLTICDPACGSGAFLNQTLEFLISEHNYIDELQNSLLGGGFNFPEVENSILENNLYGVDINKESVEIAKLSLWLRTAQKGRKLTSLNNNLKCGNSLIDEPEVAGDKAFNWQKEFPDIFKNGGFDLIIGNPPYVIVFDYENKNELENNYSVFQRNNDLYTAFYQKSIELLKNNGFLGFITPNSFIKGAYFQKLREFFIKYQIISVVDFTNFLVFEDANVFSAIMILSKNKGTKDWHLYSDLGKLKGVVKNGSLSFIPENKIQKKLNHLESFDKYFLIKDIGFNYWSVGRGKVRGDSVGSRILYSGIKLNEKDTAYVKGSNFNKYTGIEIGNYLKHNFQDLLNENDVFRYSESILETSPKLIYRQTSSKLIGTIDTHKYYCDKTVHIIINRENEDFNLKYVLAIFNSKLMNYLYSLMTEEAGRVFPQVKTVNIKQLPFKVSSADYQDSLINLVDLALEYGVEFSKSLSKFESYLKNYYSLNELTKKLKNWGDLEFLDFIKELNKAIKKSDSNKITKNDEIELNDVFELRKSEIKLLKTRIKKIEKQIDVLVYELYGLTKEEIEIVENS